MPETQTNQIAFAERFDVCLTADMTYAAPTAVTAREFTKRTSEGVHRVFFIWCDKTPPRKELVEFLAKSEVILVEMSKTTIDSLGSQNLFHIPSAALARLLLSQILGRWSIGRFLYCDGDISLVGSLAPLSKAGLPRNHIAAVGVREELIGTSNSATQEHWERHLQSIGLSENSKYFNAGVILADMDGFEKIGMDAFDFFHRNPKSCKYLDQDALNAVSENRRVLLSPRFNFQKSLFNLKVEKFIRPSIVHFNGFWKPWQPTPFTETWNHRRVFHNSFHELPEYWHAAWPINQPTGHRAKYHISALRNRFAGRKKIFARQEKIVEYLRSNKFVDTDFQLHFTPWEEA